MNHSMLKHWAKSNGVTITAELQSDQLGGYLYTCRVLGEINRHVDIVTTSWGNPGHALIEAWRWHRVLAGV